MDFDRAVAQLATLVETLERDGDERALELLELVDAIHRPALDLIARGELEHPIAQALLAMYDLRPMEDEVRVQAALDEVRPYIHSHGGEVELLGVEDGVVHLRLAGACVGCAGSAMTMQRGIEEALRAGYPAFRELVAHEPEPAQVVAPVVQIGKFRRPVFAEAGAAEDVAPGELRAVTVEDIGVLLANVEGEIYAFKNGCPVDGLPLEGGRLADAVLVCPWHNCAYDARSGKRVDDEAEPGLAVVPIAVEQGAVRVAVNAV
ncbi:MAG: NifU family protein [Actinobacteria bacterium]|nr:NifU family protein [Actinomycetota bacterium]